MNEPVLFSEEWRGEASRGRLGDVLAFIGSLLDQAACPLKIRMQIEIAAEEMFVNVCDYAYGGDPGPCTVEAKLTDREDGRLFVLTFIDEGVPYNPLEKDDPDTSLPAEERQIGGLGIFMAKKSVDLMDYEYRDSRNIVTMYKKL